MSPTTTSSARQAGRKFATDADALRADDDAAAESAVRSILSDDALRSVDHYDLFAGVPEIADMVDYQSAHLGFPSTAPALLALSILSIGCTGRVHVWLEEPGKPWSCPLHVWTLNELRSGLGKTSLLDAMGGRALSRFAKDITRSWETIELLDQDRRNEARRQRSDSLKERVDNLRALNAPSYKLPSPRLDSVTPEEYADRTVRAGFTWIATAEGIEFLTNFIFTRETAAVTALCKAFSGEDGGRDTRGDTSKGPENQPLFDRYQSVIALLCQAGNLSPAQPAHRQRLADACSRGLLARFICGRCTDDVPAKDTRTSDEVSRIEEAYADLLNKFLTVPEVEEDLEKCLAAHPCAPRDKTGDFAGHYVEILGLEDGTPAKRLRDFQAEQKKIAMSPEYGDDDRDPRKALLSRAGEVAFRVAGIIALARAGGIPAFADGGKVCVTIEEAERAIRFVERIHIPHGLSLLEQTTAGELEACGKKVLTVLAKHTKPITYSAFVNSHAKGWPEYRGRTANGKIILEATFGDLVKRGFVTETPSARAKFYEMSAAGRRAVPKSAQREAA